MTVRSRLGNPSAASWNLMDKTLMPKEDLLPQTSKSFAPAHLESKIERGRGLERKLKCAAQLPLFGVFRTIKKIWDISLAPGCWELALISNKVCLFVLSSLVVGVARTNWSLLVAPSPSPPHLNLAPATQLCFVETSKKKKKPSLWDIKCMGTCNDSLNVGKCIPCHHRAHSI